MTKVKICGITNLDDAVVSAENGADYLGFILYPPSKRAVDEKTVQCIVSHLRSLDNCPTLVGVFVNVSAEDIAETLQFCDLDLAQLHGEEPVEMLEHKLLKGRCYKAIRPNPPENAYAEAAMYKLSNEPNTGLPDLLIDAYHPQLYGGTGETSDWEIARRLMHDVPNLMLAGGLTPGNVQTAIQQVSPYIVDVASGVEAAPGKKDHDKVVAFLQAAKI